jgi:hypothetical protein
MTHRSHWTLLAAAAAACLALSACGGGSPGTTAAARTPAPTPTSAAVTVKPTGHFCADVSTVMRDVPSNPAHQKITLAMAQAQLGKVLRSSAAGYALIEPEAPASIRDAIKTIISVYRADALRARSGPITAIGRSIIKADSTGSGGSAFRKVLAYISRHCS